MSSNAIFKSDDTNAFGNNFITIKIKNPLQYPVSKIEVITNSNMCIPKKVFTDENNFQTEDIELKVNYTSKETEKLNATNIVNVVAYDMHGLRTTCPQSLTFYAKNGVISRNGQSCC